MRFFLEDKTHQNMLDTIKHLPPDTLSFVLSDNVPGKYSQAELLEIMRALPENLRSLRIDVSSMNNLVDSDIIDLINVFRGRDLIELMPGDNAMTRPAVQVLLDDVMRTNRENLREKEGSLMSRLLLQLDLNAPTVSAASSMDSEMLERASGVNGMQPG
ncbi:hypothetical protein Lgee_0798 [Legionella geestiana]|uniref:Uncharacterized protein n=1 Tax=Legionella geestiana TaxID=45065 RepID=A0A0W0U1P0_9GAMM|nr:hypothetical protein [Legionella geestiana]KTD02002.1 hypothetical protein Lgee_0798 [Legionella geestiana]QBS12044.1 hypothetical protein E4T54_04420 [Legionella geestiana]QDQ40346.1 hypothetical protein E3226_008020 [Legionella geestiana]STX53236.1 Uncharacterised protein [Legionella geestiana]